MVVKENGATIFLLLILCGAVLVVLMGFIFKVIWKLEVGCELVLVGGNLYIFLTQYLGYRLKKVI
ncbi:MAG: hypothetical protein IPN09_02135 [Bacteroidetes bacterium]|nr:hypothetical protein [Bacteroidota bacterium]